MFHYLADSTSDVINGGLKGHCQGACPSATTLTSSTVPHVIHVMMFLIAAISVIMVIVGGLRYTISAGNPSAINSAKDTILYSVVGLILATSAYIITSFVSGRFGL